MTETVMQMLKQSTSDMHNAAEGHDFQKLLAGGTLPKTTYAAYLGQLFLIHTRLEQALTHLKSVRPQFASAIEEVQYQENFLRADLQQFGVDPGTIKPLQPTKKMLDEIERLQSACPVAVIGFHYVLLGSKHGGKYIAHVLKQSYELDGAGAIYFDPYGTTFMTHWKHFVEQMNQMDLSEEEKNQMVEAARLMFATVTQVGGEIMTSAN